MADPLIDHAAAQWPEVLQSLHERGIRIAHVGIFDLMGAFRQRRLGVDDVLRVLDNGGTFVNVLPQWDAAEAVFGPGPFVGEGVSVDPASVRGYPFEADACLMIADFDGPSAALSPRKLLEQQIEKAKRKGFGVRAAFEFEFLVLKETAASLRQTGFSTLRTYAEDNRCWSGESAAVHAPLIAELTTLLAAGGIDPLALGLELGPGCFEATLRHKDPLRAADDAALFKLFTKAFCRRRELTASFMAQIDAAFPGLSGHIHISLYDLETGAGLFPDPAAGRGMSRAFEHFVAGMLALAPSAMPLTHHTTNAYRRHSPGNWAPKSASWAVQNYAAAIRVVPSPAESCRLEYRLPGSDTNPHLALAFALGAGIWGIDAEANLPPEFTGGGPDEMPAAGDRLPHDLFEAMERMAGCAEAAEIWGPRIIAHLAQACGAEEIALRRATSAAERARYLEVV